MDLIFHEKQEGSLCAQHCLNALLQGPFFTPVDLATLAQRMDDEERSFMAESGIDSEEYRTFLQQPSGNMDDSGFFSVQVISSALAVWSLDLVPYKSVASSLNPQDQNAYICNYKEHWFTIRKLGRQWFNLNSLLSGPELISTTYLSIFLATLEQGGYSIFIVEGRLPPCPAEEALLVTPAVPRTKPRTQARTQSSSDDPELEKAIKMSIALQDEDDPGLATALKVSLEGADSDVPLKEATSYPPHPDQGSQSSSSKPPPPTNSTSVDSEGSDEALLSEAIRLSLEGQEPLEHDQRRSCHQPAPLRSDPPPRPSDLDEIRRRRLAYLDKQQI